MKPTPKFLLRSLVLASCLTLAFWAGRASTPADSTGKTQPEKRPTRSADRSSSSATRTPKVVLPGAGGEAITTALQLRDFYKHSGGNYESGTAMASAALSKMNADELAVLVADLADAQASTPGYAYTLEISTACSRWAAIDPDAALRFVLSAKQASFRNAAITSLLAGIAVDNPELAQAKLASIRDPQLRASARTGLCNALATSQPDAWLAMIKDDPSLARNVSLTGIVGEWAIDDPEAAAKRIAQLPSSVRGDGISSLAKIWASKDSNAALAWANSLTDGSQRNKALGAIAGGMAAHDPDGALATLEGMSAAARRTGLASIFQTLADQDFGSAIDRANSLSDPTDQRNAILMLIGRSSSGDYYYGRDAGQIASVIAKLPAGMLREQALDQLGSRLASASREECETILQGYSEAERQKVEKNMVQSMSYYDPTRALEIYDSLPTGKADSYAIQSIFSSLASKDPEAAIKLALSRKNPAEQTRAVSIALAHMTASNPESAQRQFAALPAGPTRDAALQSMASSWGSSDADAAQQWASSLPAEERTKATLTLIPSMARNDPEAAASAITPFLSDSSKNPDISNAVSQISSKWAAQDPTAATKWAATLPEGNVKDSTLQSIAYSWCNQDPDGAGKWIDSMPDGKTRDNAVQAMISNTQQNDPATAYRWAESINDDSQRYSAINNVISNWSGSDPAAAKAAALKADLTQEQRDGLLKGLENRAKSVNSSSEVYYTADPFSEQ